MKRSNKSVKLKILKVFITIFFLLANTLNAFGNTDTSELCLDHLSKPYVGINLELESPILLESSQNGISEKELIQHVSIKIMHVPEFQYIRETAQKMGLRVWLFGGTASGFLHYVKWDLARSKGLIELQKDRFDYDFTNIFRSTQDLDIVVDATVDVAKQFQDTLARRFPHFLGSKANKWEVRTLMNQTGVPGQPGFKEALLNDTDFNGQNTDSNSVGMVEVTLSDEAIVRDLRHWDQTDSVFLQDTLNNRISYFRSDHHFTTSRAKAGENPEILSVLRLLVKAFQYELSFSENDFKQIQEIVSAINPKSVTNSTALRRIQDTAKKLVLHAVNLEYAINKLDELGLRSKLIAMGNIGDQGSFAWWLNREPLRSNPVGLGLGKTAKELDIQIVAHETNSFLAYESITRAHSGEPNVLISRQNTVGESASMGDGFYTRFGRYGARNTGLTIRFTVDPMAREGTDFTVNGDFIIFKNKKALKIIQESLNFGLDDLINLAATNQFVQVDHSDLGLLEKLKRRLNIALINDELERLINSRLESDFIRLTQILNAFQNSSVSNLFDLAFKARVFKNVYARVADLAQSSNEQDLIKYIKTIGLIFKSLNSFELIKYRDFVLYLTRIIRGRGSLELRKEALFEILLNVRKIEESFKYKRDFSQAELKSVMNEISQWHTSPDARKKKLTLELNEKWSMAIKLGEIKKLKVLVEESVFFDVNFKNLSQVSILQLAAYYEHNKIIDWLVANPEFDFKAKNAQGFTEVEQLRRSGKSELADAIEQARPEAIGQRFELLERNVNDKTADYPEGTPLVAFVRIEPSTFIMRAGSKKVLTTISKPFELMSVDVTKFTYRMVVSLIKGNLDSSDYKRFSSVPSDFKYADYPEESVTYYDTSFWVKGLNELSIIDDSQVQQTLARLFPGHKQGKQYRRPTEAEWELIVRLGGVADGSYAHSDSHIGLRNYAVYGLRSGGTKPVGLKKPVFYNGQPIYDLHGNVWKWIEDWHAESFVGGIDPVGPATGSNRVIRGGAWNDSFHSLRSDYRLPWIPIFSHRPLGVRLVRSIE